MATFGVTVYLVYQCVHIGTQSDNGTGQLTFHNSNNTCSANAFGYGIAQPFDLICQKARRLVFLLSNLRNGMQRMEHTVYITVTVVHVYLLSEC